MDNETVRRLIRLNNDFYRENARSFSATRTSAWPGWERVARQLGHPPRSVLDLACGNLRFKAFLNDDLGWDVPCYHAVDSCRHLLPASADVTFHEADVLGLLLAGRPLAPTLGLPPCDLVICSGFMHHVPGSGLRRRLVQELLACTAEGGVAAASFWRFAQDPKLARKAAGVTRGAGDLARGLGPGDYLVGWNDQPGALRYCHSFSDAEVDEMAKAGSEIAELADRFVADGRNGAMNGYLVFRRR